jgi:hypothetical protein
MEQAFLKELPGMSFDVSNVMVTLDIQKIVDKNFDNLPVAVLDIPADREVVLLPNRITVGLRGGINILGKLNEEDIRVFVYYRDVVLDTLGNVNPQVEIPQNTNLLYTSPERLRYIIKKFTE